MNDWLFHLPSHPPPLSPGNRGTKGSRGLRGFWRRLKLSGKFTLAFGLLLILTALIAITSLVALSTLHRQTSDLMSQIQAQHLDQMAGEVEIAQAQINRASRLAVTLLIAATILAAILTGLVILLLNRSITRNIKTLTLAATQLRQGNLDTEFQLDSADEVGQLAETLNLLAAQINLLVSQMEAKATEAQTRLFEALENISEGFALFDAEDRLILYNSKYLEVQGEDSATVGLRATFEQLIRMAAGQGLYPEARNEVEAWVAHRVQQHQNPQGLFVQQLSDGRWLQVSEYKTKEGGIFGIYSDVTERKQAEEALRRQNNYLNVLHETTIALVKHLDLDELLEDIISRAGQLLGAPHGYLYLVEPGQARIERKIGVGAYSNQPSGFYLMPGEGLAGKVWQTGEPLVVNDCANWAGRSSRANYENIRALAGVPLKFQGEVIGVIGMAYDIHTYQNFGEKEIELLSRFAELASLALNNARLYSLAQAEKQRSDSLLNVVIPIGVALSAEQNFDRLLEKILLEAKHFCHADAGTLYLRTDQNELNFVIVCNDTLNINMGGTSGVAIDFPPVPLYDKVTGQPNHNNVAAHVALTGQAINIPDAYEAEGFNFSGTKTFDERTGYRSTSFLTAPLKNAHNHVVGVLQLINAKAPGTGEVIPFDRSLEQIAISLSSLATVALEAYIREQSLRQQIRQLRIEIDEAKRQKQVDEIVETDFFQDLQSKARQMRRRAQRDRAKERLKDQNTG